MVILIHRQDFFYSIYTTITIDFGLSSMDLSMYLPDIYKYVRFIHGLSSNDAFAKEQIERQS